MYLYKNKMDQRLEHLFASILRSNIKGYIGDEELDRGIEVIGNYQSRLDSLSEDDITRIEHLEEKYRVIEKKGDSIHLEENNKKFGMLFNIGLLKSNLLDSIDRGVYGLKEMENELEEIGKLEKKYADYRQAEKEDILRMNEISHKFLPF